MAQYSSPLPDYLAMWTHERKTYPGDMADGELLEELTEEDGTYDAFEKDIAALNFFYGDPEFVGKCNFELLFSQSQIEKLNLNIELYRIGLNPYPSPEYERTQRMTWSDFLSNIGGLCGICLGFSFLSGIEVFYWFLKIVKNIVS